LETYIQKELNTRQLKYSTDEENFINLYAKPNSPILGKRLGPRFKEYKEAIENLGVEEIRKFQGKGSISVKDEVFDLEDILIFREAQKDSNAISNRFISIDMNCTLNRELMEEGLAREIVNRIQKSRKESGLRVNDRIMITISADDDLKSVIKTHETYIKRETLTTNIEFNSKRQELFFELDQKEFSLSLIIDGN